MSYKKIIPLILIILILSMVSCLKEHNAKIVLNLVSGTGT